MRSAAVSLVLLAALALAAPARASINQLSMFMDDNRLLYRGDDVGHKTMEELAGLGVDVVRVSVHWRAIAPAHRARSKPASLRDERDPSQYPDAAFEGLDRVLRDARRLDIGVLFNVTGGAPMWATGTRRGHHVSLQYKPDARAFGRFVEMLGRRYDGTHGAPRVTLWSLWNEPNQGALLQPQWQDGQPYSPRLYRRLARAGLAALQRSGHGDDRVLLGETAPIGVDRQGIKTNMRPGLFLRDLLCLDGAGHGCDFALRGSSSRSRNCVSAATRESSHASRSACPSQRAWSARSTPRIGSGGLVCQPYSVHQNGRSRGRRRASAAASSREPRRKLSASVIESGCASPTSGA